MARRGTQRNELILSDPVSGSEIGFYYSIPTTRDHVAIAKNDGKRADEEVLENAIDVGLKIITGVRDGDFERQDGDAWKAISSNPESPDYYAEWKEFLREFAPDLILAFVNHVFRRQAMAVKRSDTEGK